MTVSAILRKTSTTIAQKNIKSWLAKFPTYAYATKRPISVMGNQRGFSKKEVWGEFANEMQNYIYIYIYRERERDVCIHVYIYIYIHV